MRVFVRRLARWGGHREEFPELVRRRWRADGRLGHDRNGHHQLRMELNGIRAAHLDAGVDLSEQSRKRAQLVDRFHDELGWLLEIGDFDLPHDLCDRQLRCRTLSLTPPPRRPT
jgi:hypothetical protein